MGSKISSQVKNSLHNLNVLGGDWGILDGVCGVKEVDDTLSRLDGQSMSSQGNILGLLNSLRVQECEAALADGADDGVVGEWGGLEGDVDDEREVGKTVQVRNGRDQNRRASDNRDRLAVAQRVEGGQEGVLIVANGLDLAVYISNFCLTEEAMAWIFALEPTRGVPRDRALAVLLAFKVLRDLENSESV